MKQMVRTKMATVVSCRTKCDTGNSCPEPMSCMDCLTKTCCKSLPYVYCTVIENRNGGYCSIKI